MLKKILFQFILFDNILRYLLIDRTWNYIKPTIWFTIYNNASITIQESYIFNA